MDNIFKLKLTTSEKSSEIFLKEADFILIPEENICKTTFLINHLYGREKKIIPADYYILHDKEKKFKFILKASVDINEVFNISNPLIKMGFIKIHTSYFDEIYKHFPNGEADLFLSFDIEMLEEKNVIVFSKRLEKNFIEKFVKNNLNFLNTNIEYTTPFGSFEIINLESGNKIKAVKVDKMDFCDKIELKSSFPAYRHSFFKENGEYNNKVAIYRDYFAQISEKVQNIRYSLSEKIPNILNSIEKLFVIKNLLASEDFDFSNFSNEIKTEIKDKIKNICDNTTGSDSKLVTDDFNEIENYKVRFENLKKEIQNFEQQQEELNPKLFKNFREQTDCNIEELFNFYKESIEKINSLKGTIEQNEKTLKDFNDKLAKGDELLEKCKELKKTLEVKLQNAIDFLKEIGINLDSEALEKSKLVKILDAINDFLENNKLNIYNTLSFKNNSDNESDNIGDSSQDDNDLEFESVNFYDDDE